MNDCIRQLESMIGFLTVDRARVKMNLVKRIISKHPGLSSRELKPPMYYFLDFFDDLLQSGFVEDITVEKGGIYDENLVDSIHSVIEQILLGMPNALYDVMFFFNFYDLSILKEKIDALAGMLKIEPGVYDRTDIEQALTPND